MDKIDRAISYHITNIARSYHSTIPQAAILNVEKTLGTRLIRYSNNLFIFIFNQIFHNFVADLLMYDSLM